MMSIRCGPHLKINLQLRVGKHLPYRERRISVNPENWINDVILSAMYRDNILHIYQRIEIKLWRYWALYKRASNIAISKVNKNICGWNNWTTSTKPKYTRNRLKQFIPLEPKSVHSYFGINGKIISRNEEIANVFN